MGLLVSLKEKAGREPARYLADAFRQVEIWANGPPQTYRRTPRSWTISTTRQQLSKYVDVFACGSLAAAGSAETTILQVSADGQHWATAQSLVIPAGSTVGFGVWLPSSWWVKVSDLTNATAVVGSWW